MMTKPKKATVNYLYNIKTDMYTFGKVLASPNKVKVLYSLSFPKTPKEISKHTNINFPTTSKTIKELEDLSLVSINNKDLRKGKIVSVSRKGKDLLSDLDKKKKKEEDTNSLSK
ncbi:MAG: winged helix-turn-helix domain-containing protein [archaeon]